MSPRPAVRRASRSGTSTRHRPGWLLLFGLVVQVLPVLALPWALSQDGPAHVDGAWVLLHHGDDGALGALLRRQYAVDLSPVPNMLTALLLAALLRILPPGAAEKVVVVGFVVLLVAGLRYALRGVDHRAGWLAVAALPLAGSELVVYGFYDFCWGMALALFAVGLALHRRAGWSLRSGIGLTLLMVLTWSAHLLPWLVAALLIGALALVRLVAAGRADLGWLPGLRVHLAAPVLALLPTAALSGAYALNSRAQPGAPSGGMSWVRLGWLLSLYRPLVVGSWWELAPALAVATALAGLLAVALRRRPAGDTDESDASTHEPAGSAEDGAVRTARDALRGADRRALGWATALSALAVLLTPTQLGTQYGLLPDRLAWFPPLLLVLFCATRPPSRAAVRAGLAGALVLASTAAVLIRLPTELRDQQLAAEQLSVAADLPGGATFVVLPFTRYHAAVAPAGSRPDPLRHLSGLIAVRAGGIDVGYYEAAFPYFQVRFRAHPSVRQLLDPGLDGLEQVPPEIDLRAAAGHLDYVLVVGLDRANQRVRDSPRTARLLADLRAGYQRTAVSQPTHDVSVWRRRRAARG